MASILSGKFTKVADAKANPKETKDDDDAAQKKSRVSKLNPLLNSRTADYVDDLDLYVPRISRAERYQYWQQLTKNTRPRRLPNSFRSWVQKEVDTVNERDSFPASSLLYFSVVKTCFWDQLYLNFFVFWWILVVFYYDGWASKYAPLAIVLNSNNTILLLPPIFMFVSQLIPLLGTLYYIHYCNDLVKFLAASEMATWGFVCVLTAQYVEYFYYSGQGRGHFAGICRKGSPRVGAAMAVKAFLARRFKQSAEVSPVDKDIEGSSVDDNIAESIDLEKGAAVDGRTAEDADEAVSVDGASGHAVLAVLSASPQHGFDESNNDEVEGDDEGGGSQVTEWKCIVCLTENKASSVVSPSADITFGEKGVFYKRAYAKIAFGRPKPACRKCYAYCDYQPPRGSAHLFPHNPKPFVAFEHYPISSEVQAGLKIDRLSRLQYRLQSFFYGIHNVPNSLMQPNDWRLRKYTSDSFPELPRYILSADEFYQLGEIVECKQQKLDWTRARVIKVHLNKTYDIRYDTMDEIRFVLHKSLRTIPEKREYAFRVEMAMVVVVLLSPLGGALGVLSGNAGCLLLGTLIATAALLAVRLVTFCQYLYNYYNAGCIVIARLSGLYICPLLLVMIASIAAVVGGRDPSSWASVAALLIVGLIACIPVLYMMRPTFALIGGALFFQVGLGMILVAAHASQPTPFAFVAIPLAPFLTTALSLKLLRRYLHSVWDVSLIMHPAKDTSIDNPSILHVAWDALLECFDG